MDTEELLKKLRNLHVDRDRSRYTVGKAPHKAILLLSLIMLDEHGKIELDDVRPEFYLKQTWDELWSVLDYPRPGPITMPLYHLRSEGFWHLDFFRTYRPTTSIENFNNQLRHASLDNDFIHILQDHEQRNMVINTLLQEGGYFSPQETERLRLRLEDLDDSFVYEERIVQELANEFHMNWNLDIVTAKTTSIIAKRDPAFRRLVLSAYDESCAVCGMRVSTSSGISVIDAAHILPFNRFYNDDVRNGLGLCKTHHWLFDRGLLSVDDSYKIMVSKDIEDDWPQGVIKKYHGKKLTLPQNSAESPSELAMQWHSENVFI